MDNPSLFFFPLSYVRAMRVELNASVADCGLQIAAAFVFDRLHIYMHAYMHAGRDIHNDGVT